MQNSLQSHNTQCLIICLGNPLHGDDGLGYEVFKELQQLSFPPGTEVLNGGSAGLALLPLISDFKEIFLVDVFKDKTCAPGKILHFHAPQGKGGNNHGSLEHGGNIADLLTLVPELVNDAPHMQVFGVVGSDFTPYSNALSNDVKNAIPALCRLIRNEARGHAN